MARLIDKDALVAEINKRIIDAPVNNIGHQRVWAYNDVKDIIDTLEVKEVDFDAEWEKYFEHRGEIASINVKHLAKHFFELVPKQEWNEEDENECNHILKLLNLVAEEQETKGYNNLISSVNWLKSLKERVQSKQSEMSKMCPASVQDKK